MAGPALRGRRLQSGPKLLFWGLPLGKLAGVPEARATVRGWPQLQHQVSEWRWPALAAPPELSRTRPVPLLDDVSAPDEEVLTLWSSLGLQELLTCRAQQQHLWARGKAVLSEGQERI